MEIKLHVESEEGFDELYGMLCGEYEVSYVRDEKEPNSMGKIYDILINIGKAIPTMSRVLCNILKSWYGIYHGKIILDIDGKHLEMEGNLKQSDYTETLEKFFEELK